MSCSRRTYTVIRDRRELGPGFGVEELSLFADELTDPELIALPDPERTEALREIGCILEEDRQGRLCVVTDPALDDEEETAATAALEAA